MPKARVSLVSPGPDDYQKAMLNILEDWSEEKVRLQAMQSAVINILEDFGSERRTQEQMQRATLNVLEDFSEEKAHLEDVRRAALNILDDFAGEKDRSEDTQRAALNILEDFVEEKARLEDMQRAMLNLLDDFGMEREKAESANILLRETIDSLQRAKDTADVANRELEAFAYSVSHDLRAPLRTIAGFSDVLFEDYFDKLDEEGKDSLQRITAATERMGQLIDDLLNLSRLTRADVNRQHCDLSAIVRNIAEAKQLAQPDRKVEVVVEPGLLAEMDEHLAVVMFENLIENAFKFTGQRDRARIEFGARIDGDRPTYFIKDNGAGFDKIYSNKLFQPFQRLHSSSDFPGTGIGLATVKRIVQRHGGTVWIEGEKGEGATVYFTL